MGHLKAMLDARPESAGRRLILHVGATKTGTTSLQFHLCGQRRPLIDQGILYPAEGTVDPPHLKRDMKHNWFGMALRSDDEILLARRLSKCLDECRADTKTIVLSAEGIFTHWWDYSTLSKSWFGTLACHFEFSCFVWFREPVAFFKSCYVQDLKHPRLSGIESYGRDMSATEMLEIPWAARHLEYDALIEDMRAAMGSDNVFPFAYTPELVPEFYQLLGLDAPEIAYPRGNVTSLNSAGVEMLRLLNRFALEPGQKRRGYELICEINALIGDRAKPFELEPEAVRRIRAICPATAQSLREMHESSLLRWNARYPSAKPASV